MSAWAPRLTVAALALSGAICFAQTAPGGVTPAAAPRGATHDCSGMSGTALETCRQLNRNGNVRAPTGAGTANDCSGMTGAPLDTCRRVTEAETSAPTTSAGTSQDCSGQIGDALRACRALNGQSPEPESAATTGAGTTGGTAQ